MRKSNWIIGIILLLYIMVYESVIFPYDFELLCLFIISFISYEIYYFLVFKKQVTQNAIFLLSKERRLYDNWKIKLISLVILGLLFVLPDDFSVNRIDTKADYEMWIILVPFIFFQLSVSSYQNYYYLTHTGIIENININEIIKWVNVEQYEVQNEKGLIHLTRQDGQVYQLRTDITKLQMKEKKLRKFFDEVIKKRT